MAQIAQTYSEQCIFSPQGLFDFVGENLGVTTNPVDDYEGLFESWLNESSFYNFTTNTCSLVCDQYTQVGKALSYIAIYIAS